MTPFKNTTNLYKTIISILDENEVLNFHYDKTSLFFETNEVFIRAIFNENNGNGPCGIRFRDSNFTQHPIVYFVDYDSSTYFNAAVDIQVSISKDDLDKIVDECNRVIKKTLITIYLIIESKIQ